MVGRGRKPWSRWCPRAERREQFLDVLAAQDFAPLWGLRIGLVTHPAAVNHALDHAAKVIGEVKNVAELRYTNQLRDFVLYAQKYGYRFDLYLRQGAVISDELEQLVRAGEIVLTRLKM